MRTLIVSDLHLGNGGPYDVFEGGTALPALLDHLSGNGLHVIVNGDAVDFLMNDDPLELDVARAEQQARAIATFSASAAVVTFSRFGFSSIFANASRICCLRSPAMFTTPDCFELFPYT